MAAFVGCAEIWLNRHCRHLLIVDALVHQVKGRTPIGRLAIANRMLTVREVFQILNLQAGSNTLFGQVALEFGFLEEDELNALLILQRQQVTPIGELLVESGALTREQFETELAEFHQLSDSDRSTVSARHSNRRTASEYAGAAAGWSGDSARHRLPAYFARTAIRVTGNLPALPDQNRLAARFAELRTSVAARPDV